MTKNLHISIADVLANLHQSLLIDIRPLKAFEHGHIPGAINIEWTSLMDQQRNLRIRSDAEQILGRAGLSRDKQVTTHCQSHHRSGFTYMVARILGYDNISAYDGSWAEWGNLDDMPVERGYQPD